jgi:RNA polymerase sigma factor (TIGR02999 family)
MNEFTETLLAADKGDLKAADELLPLVYAELRRLAAVKLQGERPGYTLQPTALVHEAWLKLTGGKAQLGNLPMWRSSRHFFRAAAKAMRLILIDRARAEKATKRDGGKRADTSIVEVPDPAFESTPGAFLDLIAALEKLAAESPDRAEIVDLHYMLGKTFAEAAEIMGVSDRQAKRYWEYARAWLRRELQSYQRCH